MSTNNENNKRVAKNTILLYIRMLFMLIISLYTSRIVLKTLGIEDYGIYNVVGGIILMTSFITNSLSAAASRFITYDLGTQNIIILKETFGNLLTIHLLLATFILLLGETIGLWFLNTQLQIPQCRIIAANWVYQFSILSFITAILSIPYTALIIAHERMGAFAYLTILDAILKLIIVYLLTISPIDKLITYSFLLFCIQALDRILYNQYCRRNFIETKTKLRFNKRKFTQIFSFAGWTMNGNLAIIGYTQGLNILINIFFGPSINAARGIAVQVQNVIRNFCNNFQMALNPQITKSYAQNDLKRMHELIIISSKFSFYLLLFISLPILLETDIILNWWLETVPVFTETFLRIMICSCMLIALSNPIIISVHATGIIKRFQLIEGSLLLTIVPLAYIQLKLFHSPPYIVFLTHLIIEILTQFVRVKIVLPMIGLDYKVYNKKVISPIIKTCIAAITIPIILSYIPINNNSLKFIIVSTSAVISTTISIYLIGCNQNEKLFITQKAISFFKK